MNISLCRKLAEVEIIGSPEATESVFNKINTEHVICQVWGVGVTFLVVPGRKDSFCKQVVY